MTLAYQIKLTPDDNGSFLATAPALPEVTTFGRTHADALVHAVDAIEEALAARMAQNRDIPTASRTATAVRLPLLTSLKVMLYVRARTAGVTRAELARRLGWHREQVDRLFRLGHRSQADQIEAAFRVLGVDVDVQLQHIKPRTAAAAG